jgi:hypothetical protein
MGVAALALAGSVSTVAALLSLEGRAEPPAHGAWPLPAWSSRVCRSCSCCSCCFPESRGHCGDCRPMPTRTAPAFRTACHRGT